MIQRVISNRIRKRIGAGKAIVLLGARQVGKTSLIRSLLGDGDYLFYDGDDPAARTLLMDISTQQIRQLIGDNTVMFIDEAQRIDNIGITAKIIIDQLPHVQLWISGSSSLDLQGAVNESLTGRKWSFELYPISWEEYEDHVGYLAAEQDLENRLLYGFYPDVINNPGDEIEILRNLVDGYLYKDILTLTNLRKSHILDNLVRALALQIGSEVNSSELSRLLGIDQKTVDKYIDILEKAFVVFSLRSYSRNQRNEIRKGRKVYFYDVGIRNSILGNFDDLDLRTDKGALWENFLISERVKQNEYHKRYTRNYFWRTKQQQEIDYVEEMGTNVSGFEIKWSSKRTKRLSRTFVNAYQAAEYNVTRDNFRNFVRVNSEGAML